MQQPESQAAYHQVHNLLNRNRQGYPAGLRFDSSAFL